MRPEHWFYTIPLRLRSLFRRNSVEQELDEELRYHVERQIEQNIARGMSPIEARYAALRALKDVEVRKEECRQMRRVSFIEDIMRDLRYGCRFLLNNRGLTIVGTLVLALGIGASSTIFSVVSGVLLKPLPYTDQDQLVVLSQNEKATQNSAGTFNGISYPNFSDIRSQNHVFSEMGAFQTTDCTLTGAGDADRIQMTLVTGGVFPVLKIAPLLGRTFVPTTEPSSEIDQQEVIISARLWQRHFGSDPNIIGRAITLNNTSLTVIGVMPGAFKFPFDSEENDAWAPVAARLNGQNDFREMLQNRAYGFFIVMGRLKPGIDLPKAQAELDVIAGALHQKYQGEVMDRGVSAFPALALVVGNARDNLLLVFFAVGCVFLIACGNVANLLLARGLARQREIAIRTALGAGRFRIIRQLVTESLLLSSLGCLLGLIFAYCGIRLLLRFGGDVLPRVSNIKLDAGVLVFTIVVSLATGLIFGLIPAIQVSLIDLTQAFKEGGGSTGGVRGGQIRSLLIVAEVALTLVLLVGAGLLVQSFFRLRHVNTGFDTHNVMTLNFVLPRDRYNEIQQDAFYKELFARVRALPGVNAAGGIYPLPFSGYNTAFDIEIEGHPTPPDQRPKVDFLTISPNYFSAINIPVINGRDFTERDDKSDPLVVIVSEALARRFFPGEDPIGKHVRPPVSFDNQEPQMREIIGVVSDAKYHGLRADTSVMMYVPHSQVPFYPMATVIRGNGNPLNLTTDVRSIVRSLDKDVPVYDVKLLEKDLSDSISQDRFVSMLLAMFAVAGLFLTAIGLYGVMAYLVTQRTREIGIRMALGADRDNVLRLVIWQGMKLALVGVIIGFGLSYGLMRYVSSFLFGVRPSDPVTLIAVVTAIAITVLAACILPARRATRVDPMVALRSE